MNWVDHWATTSEKHHWAIMGWGLLAIILGAMFEHRSRVNRIRNLKKVRDIKRYRRRKNKIA